MSYNADFGRLVGEIINVSAEERILSQDTERLTDFDEYLDGAYETIANSVKR